MNILIAYEDDSQGHNFFSGLANDLLTFLKTTDNSCSQIFTRANLTRKNVEEYIRSLVEKPFVFITYTHGEKDRLCVNNTCFEFFAKHPDNSYFFANSMIYSFSCEAGDEFAKGVVSNGCNCFIGYDNLAWYDLEHIPTFISIANSGIKELLKGKDCKTAIQKIREKYSLFIDYFNNDENEYPAFLKLSKNYRALTIQGNENYKIDN